MSCGLLGVHVCGRRDIMIMTLCMHTRRTRVRTLLCLIFFFLAVDALYSIIIMRASCMHSNEADVRVCSCVAAAAWRAWPWSAL